MADSQSSSIPAGSASAEATKHRLLSARHVQSCTPVALLVLGVKSRVYMRMRARGWGKSGERVANEGLGKIGERLVTRPGREALKGIGQRRTLPETIEWLVAGADGAMRAIIQSGVRRGCHGGCSSSATSGMPAIEQPPSIWQSAERFDKQRAEAEQSGYCRWGHLRGIAAVAPRGHMLHQKKSPFVVQCPQRTIPSNPMRQLSRGSTSSRGSTRRTLGRCCCCCRRHVAGRRWSATCVPSYCSTCRQPTVSWMRHGTAEGQVDG